MTSGLNPFNSKGSQNYDLGEPQERANYTINVTAIAFSL
jgi:hypothetical protein